MVAKKKQKKKPQKGVGQGVGGGRPPGCTPEFIAKAKKYLDSWDENGDVVPSQVGMALYCEVSLRPMIKWGNEHAKFKHIFRRCNAMQHNYLLNKGLSGEYNSTIAKVMMTKHGYKDEKKIEQEIIHSFDKDLPDSIKELMPGAKP